MIRVPRRSEAGFTLIELLIVIVIIGILAAVVVFAVSGITDRGQTSACSADLANMRNAAETMRASASATYGNETSLISNGYLTARSSLHNITVGADVAAATASTNSEGAATTGAAYVVKYQDADCGTVGNVVS